MNQLLNQLSRYSHILPRIVLATTFLVHGFPKLTNTDSITAMGIPMYVIGLFEVGGALLLLIGITKDWATRIGALLISVIMVGAIALVHIKDGWQGNEWQLLILAVCLMYATKGNSINKGG